MLKVTVARGVVSVAGGTTLAPLASAAYLKISQSQESGPWHALPTKRMISATTIFTVRANMIGSFSDTPWVGVGLHGVGYIVPRMAPPTATCPVVVKNTIWVP